MRISDWSSDVCSSHVYEQQAADAYTTSVRTFRSRIAASLRSSFDDMHGQLRELNSTMSRFPAFSNNEKYRLQYDVNPSSKALYDFKSDESRVRKECVRTVRSRWSQYLSKKI